MSRRTKIMITKAPGARVLHFVDEGDYRSYCGRYCEGWTVEREANLFTDADNVTVCKRCKLALTN